MAVTVFAGVLREHDASLTVSIINGAADRPASDVLLLLALPRNRLDTRALLAIQPNCYIDSDGGSKLDELLAGFEEFFRQHSEPSLKRFGYREARAQLLLQACLQRVFNSGGHIDREYGVGRGRIDLFVGWPHPTGTQRFVIECKVVRDGLDSTIRKGLLQTLGYMDRCDS